MGGNKVFLSQRKNETKGQRKDDNMKKVFTVQSRHILLVALFFLGVFLLMQSWRPFYLEVHHCITSTLWIVKRLKSEFCFEVATSRCPIGFKISSYTRAKSFKYFCLNFTIRNFLRILIGCTFVSSQSECVKNCVA